MPVFALFAFGLIASGGGLAFSRGCKRCARTTRKRNVPSSAAVASAHAAHSSGIDNVEGEENERVAELDRLASSVAAAGSRSMASTVERCRYLTTSGANRDLLQEDGDVVEGGFGSVVFYSTRSEPQQRFALKRAKDTPAGTRQMLREVAFFHGLRNLPPLSNVVKVTEIVQRPPMLLMDREEATLGDMLQGGDDLPDLDAVARILDGVLSGVEGLHRLGFLHRDIKPDNVLVGHGQRGILVDFGLCLKAEESRDGKGIGDGTPEYAAPETGTRSWSLTAEIYSVFVCFSEAVLGRCPFGGEELFLIKEERVADITGQEEEAQYDVDDFSKEIEEASTADDLDQLQDDLRMANEKLKTVRVKMTRLQLGSWALDKAALAELASMGEPLSFFLPAAAEEDEPSAYTAACLEAKSQPNKLFEDDWANWLPSSSHQDMKEAITRTINYVLSVHALDPDPASRPQSVQMAREVLHAAAMIYNRGGS